MREKAFYQPLDAISHHFDRDIFKTLMMLPSKRKTVGDFPLRIMAEHFMNLNLAVFGYLLVLTQKSVVKKGQYLPKAAFSLKSATLK